jgi:hypothetical protein
MRAQHMPGWAFVSYGNDVSTRRFYDEIVAVKLDGSGAVARLGHIHSDFTTAASASCQSLSQTLTYVNPPSGHGASCTTIDSDFQYRSEPHCVPSWDGKRVDCASNYLVNATGGGCCVQDYLFDLR